MYDQSTTSQLARLQNRATRYEVSASRAGRAILVGYTARKSRPGLLSLLVDVIDNRTGERRIDLLAAHTGTDPREWEWGGKANEGAHCGPWLVRFTGRTQREAILEGKLAESIYSPTPTTAPAPLTCDACMTEPAGAGCPVCHAEGNWGDACVAKHMPRAHAAAQLAAAGYPPVMGGSDEAGMYTADTHPQYNRKCRRCGSTILAGTKHWAIDSAASGFECWQCPPPAAGAPAAEAACSTCLHPMTFHEAGRCHWFLGDERGRHCPCAPAAEAGARTFAACQRGDHAACPIVHDRMSGKEQCACPCHLAAAEPGATFSETTTEDMAAWRAAIGAPAAETDERHEWIESGTGRRAYCVSAVTVVNGQRIGRTLEAGDCDQQPMLPMGGGAMTDEEERAYHAAQPATLVLREIKRPIDCDACYRLFQAGDTLTLDSRGKPLCPRCATLLQPGHATPRTLQDLEALPRVRVFSSCGPCLDFYRLVKANRTTYKLAYRNGDGVSFRNEYKGSVHVAPCRSCTDHTQTQYPNGYMD